ncbi:MAG TPA: hypothetical protein VHC22_18920 [Pirellulales bacterium]|nr:hypothetical protein [Pirellulales bacterium]
MKRFRISAILVTAGLGLGIWAVATAQEYPRRRPDVVNPARPAVPAAAKGAPPPNGSPDFNGRFVAVSIGEGNQPKVLAKVHFQEIHGRRFLVGEEASSTFSVAVGAPIHVAWDSVTAFYVFDSLTQYEQAMRKALEQAQGAFGQMFGGLFQGSGQTIRYESFPPGVTPEPVVEQNPQIGSPQTWVPMPAPNQPTFAEPKPTQAPPKRIVSQPVIVPN